MEQVCTASRRESSEVMLLAVTKKKSPEIIKEVLNTGLYHLGENYVQEFLEKKERVVFPNVKWHFIGHIQSKKVKDIVGQVELIHSVDRLKTLIEIQRRAEEKQIKQRVLLQVNIANEGTKSGFSVNELDSVISKGKTYENIILSGLMIMPPLFKDSEQVRPLFKATKKLQESLKDKYSLKDFVELSMGTSGDYLIAIEEGATIVRLGTLLVGERNYSKTCRKTE